jgi:Cu(I)/Ag(I) efflux system protein CusF
VKHLVSLLAAGLLATAAWAQPAMTTGEITKLDKAGGRVTLKHGEIKNLDMPPMTMNFRVANPKLLDSVNVGDRVRFVAEKVNGQFTVTVLNKAR